MYIHGHINGYVNVKLVRSNERARFGVIERNCNIIIIIVHSAPSTAHAIVNGTQHTVFEIRRNTAGKRETCAIFKTLLLLINTL